jgi:multicomponent Na+:H+ antiporter subunit D
MTITLDVDWLYRRLGRIAIGHADALWAGSASAVQRRAIAAALRFIAGIHRHHGPRGVLARTWPTGSMALWATLLLGAYLVIYYI